MIRSLLFVIVLFLVGCGSSGSSTPANVAPVAKMIVNTTTLSAGETLELDAGNSVDSDGNIVSYEWLVQDNQRIGTQETATWTAPMLTQQSIYKITLVVTDDAGASHSSSLDVIINAQTNALPVARIVPSATSVATGGTITFDASSSSDSDGNITSYTWSDNLGSGQTATWMAPDTAGDYTISVTVVDNEGGSDAETVTVTVNEQANQSPVAVISGDAPYAAFNQTITLSAATSTDDKGINTYVWSHQGVSLGADESLMWTAPSSMSSHTISLTVTDAEGLQSSTSIVINVFDPSSSISDIQMLILDSNTSAAANVTYICVGDSTRVESVRDQAHLLFEQIEANLTEYNISSHLLARGSHRLEQFNNPSLGEFPTYNDVRSLIPGTGSTTIVDMSLGINDLFKFDTDITAEMLPGIRSDIIAQLKEAIYHIKAAKPDTTILLTSPNPLYSWDTGTETYMNAYRTVSSQWSMAFVNFHDDVFVGYDANERAAMYRGLDETPVDEIHYSLLGLSTMADYILSHILPSGS